MKNIKLYNVIFPVWLLLIVPTVWLIVLPGNFLIDSALLIGAMYALKMQDKKIFYKKTIWKAYLFGLLADVIGSAFLFVTVMLLDLSTTGDDLYLTIPAVIISGVCIFLFDYFVSFKNSEKPVRLRLALTFAVVTAPYTFLIPTTWIY